MAIFVLLSLGAVAFLYYQNQQLKSMLASYQTPVASPTPIATSDPTINWKTYTYKDITFKYPADWILGTEKITAVRPPATKKGEDYPAVTFFAIDNPKNLSVKEFVDEAAKEGRPPNLYSQSAKELTVSGVKGYYQTDQNCEPLWCDIFAVSFNNKVYEITIVYTEIDAQKLKMQQQELRPVFNQILSTFKFIEATPPGGPTSTPSSY